MSDSLDVKVAVHEEKIDTIISLLKDLKLRQNKHDEVLADLVALKNKGLGSIWVLVLIGGIFGYLFSNWSKIKAALF